MVYLSKNQKKHLIAPNPFKCRSGTEDPSGLLDLVATQAADLVAVPAAAPAAVPAGDVAESSAAALAREGAPATPAMPSTGGLAPGTNQPPDPTLFSVYDQGLLTGLENLAVDHGTPAPRTELSFEVSVQETIRRALTVPATSLKFQSLSDEVQNVEALASFGTAFLSKRLEFCLTRSLAKDVSEYYEKKWAGRSSVYQDRALFYLFLRRTDTTFSRLMDAYEKEIQTDLLKQPWATSHALQRELDDFQALLRPSTLLKFEVEEILRKGETLKQVVRKVAADLEGEPGGEPQPGEGSLLPFQAGQLYSWRAVFDTGFVREDTFEVYTKQTLSGPTTWLSLKLIDENGVFLGSCSGDLAVLDCKDIPAFQFELPPPMLRASVEQNVEIDLESEIRREMFRKNLVEWFQGKLKVSSLRMPRSYQGFDGSQRSIELKAEDIREIFPSLCVALNENTRQLDANLQFFQTQNLLTPTISTIPHWISLLEIFIQEVNAETFEVLRTPAPQGPVYGDAEYEVAVKAYQALYRCRAEAGIGNWLVQRLREEGFIYSKQCTKWATFATTRLEGILGRLNTILNIKNDDLFMQTGLNLLAGDGIDVQPGPVETQTTQIKALFQDMKKALKGWPGGGSFNLNTVLKEDLSSGLERADQIRQLQQKNNELVEQLKKADANLDELRVTEAAKLQEFKAQLDHEAYHFFKKIVDATKDLTKTFGANLDIDAMVRRLDAYHSLIQESFAEIIRLRGELFMETRGGVPEQDSRSRFSQVWPWLTETVPGRAVGRVTTRLVIYGATTNETLRTNLTELVDAFLNPNAR